MIKAIPTNYKGINFRSRVEAKWALYFDLIGLKWEYEQEGYKLEDGTYYLPDFFIPEFGFVEIKGKKPTKGEIEKAKSLSKNDDDWCVAIFDGVPSLERSCYKCYSEGEECCEIIFCWYSVSKWGQTPFYGEVDLADTFYDDKEIVEKVNNYRFGVIA